MGMAEILEGTDAYNMHHAYVTGKVPITVHDGGDGMTPEMVTVPRPVYGDRMHDDDPTPDPFDDDTPLACGIENPEQCESCT